MDATNSSHGGKGAYEPVTISEDNVTTKPSEGQQGFWTRPRIIIITIISIFLAIIVVIVAIVLTVKGSSEQAGTGLMTTTSTDGVTSQEKKTQGTPSSIATTTAITTTSAPVEGNFAGTVTLQKNYEFSYDDTQGPEFTNLATNFTRAMTILFNTDSSIQPLYGETTVDRMNQNGTYVDLHFTVFVTAIQRGAQDFLVSQLKPLPSKSLKTYPVIWAKIEPETAGDSPA